MNDLKISKDASIESLYEVILMTDLIAQNKAFKEILSEIEVILGDQNSSVMSRVGSNLARRWVEDKTFKSPKEALDAIAHYLQSELGLAEEVTVTIDADNKATLHISGCKPCAGALVKQKGGTAACPISQFAIVAMKKATPNIKKVSLEGIQKTPEEAKSFKCHQKITFEL